MIFGMPARPPHTPTERPIGHPLGIRGRGAGLNPGNRHEGSDPRNGAVRRLHVLGDALDDMIRAGEIDPTKPSPAGSTPTEVLPDHARSILNKVDSPDLGMSWTLNPYRGCEHGCIYCYARPDHERLGFSSGLDFETKIMAKHDAPALLCTALARPTWQAEAISMSGVTDCYQPIERDLRITRGCLEVMAECRQPVGIVTKNRLITRDLDLLRELAHHSAVRVAVSITTLDPHLAFAMEPRASSPANRLQTIRDLTDAGVPTMLMLAPVIPALNDTEIPAILEAAAAAGAQQVGWVMLRLPHQVKDLFLDWLQRHFPDRAARIESHIRAMHFGDLYTPTFGHRQRGSSPVADQIANVMNVFAKRFGINQPMPELSGSAFRRPTIETDPNQMGLFT